MISLSIIVLVLCLIIGAFFYNQRRSIPQNDGISSQEGQAISIKLDKLIIGLGNPGQNYENMRHNIGKLLISHIAKRYNQPLKKIDEGYLAILNENTDQPKIGLFNTHCYMNISGKSVKKVIDKQQMIQTKIIHKNQIRDLQNIIVAHDDLDNPFGKIKIKEGGSAEGHNGIKSIIDYVDTKDFKRLKLGIDRPNSREQSVISPYVLSNFPKDQMEKLSNQIFDNAINTLKDKSYLN